MTIKEIIEFIKDYFGYDAESKQSEENIINELNNLEYQYQLRKADTEVLNEIKNIIGINSEALLKERIKELVEKEKINASPSN